MATESEPVSMTMKDHEALIGMYTVFYRNGQKVPAKIIRIEKGSPNKIEYELVGGPEKGQVWRSKFDDSQTAKFYNEGNLALALLET